RALKKPFTPLGINRPEFFPEHVAMPANPPSADDTESVEKWDACWNNLNRLPGRNLPAAALHAEAARIINSCRAVTEGRGIERIEERARVAYREAAHRLATRSDDHLNRFMLTLGGALSVLRRVPREVAGL